MNRSIPWIAVVTAFPVLALAHPPDPAEEGDIAKKIVAACPGQQALAERASQDFHDPVRLQVALGEYRQLAGCAKNVSIVFVRIGFAEFAAGDFAASERDYRRAVSIEPSYTNKLSLLEALVRENKPEADGLYVELSKYDGDRDDIWAALAYVAFHRDDVVLMREASARAIQRNTKWWQAWFTGAVAEGLSDHPDYARALSWLDKADALGAPVATTGKIRGALEEMVRRHRARSVAGDGK